MRILRLAFPTIIGAFFVLAFPPALEAQGLNICPGLTQGDMNICAANDFQKADAELNAVYRDLMSKVSDIGKARLQDALRAWISYRDRQCEFSTAGSVGGSVHSMVLSGCLAELTRAQIAVLRLQLDCVGGDVACGNQ